jgi:4-diphosphocytidyl-2-C-methyl-D-erythritol kinase
LSQPLRVHAPAKVNLGLRIRARRPDGYHELESVFAPLDLADRLSLRVAGSARPEVTLRVTGGAGVPEDDTNLAARAARRFLEAAGLDLRVEIELDKRVPAGAGLGGGSSDAAAVLRALDAWRPGAVAAGTLHELALGLGADVPYFLDPRPARVSGVGERREPLALPALCLLLVNPGLALSTAEVFRAFDALVPDPRAPGPGDARSETGALHVRGAPDLSLRNDLEPAAIRLCPAIRRLRAQLAGLSPRALGVGMSGSGPTLYAVYPDAAGAERALAGAGFRDPVWARVASTLESG